MCAELITKYSCAQFRRKICNNLCFTSVDEHNVLSLWDTTSQAWCEHFFRILKMAHFFQSWCIPIKAVGITTVSPCPCFEVNSFSSALSLHDPPRTPLTTVPLAQHISFLALEAIG